MLVVFFLILFSLISISNQEKVNINQGTSEKPPLLLLISFDGFRWDYLENYTLNNFQEYFVKNGVKADKGIHNSFTTVTFPNHWTIVTGLYPESHGVVANSMYDNILNQTYYDFGPNDNDTKWFGQNKDAIPIWILNQLHDKSLRRSGIIGAFPGSNVPISNTTAFKTLDYELGAGLNWFLKVDKIVDWYLDKENPINFGVLYFPEPDDTGHEFGPYSNEVAKVIHNCDYIIGYLIQKLKYVGLYDQMNIIITSDHGMDTASIDKAINLNDYVDISKFDSYGGLTQINIFPKNPNDEEEIYEGLKNVPHYNVYRKNEVLNRLNYKHNNRIGPIVMYGDVGYEIFRQNKEKFNWNSWKGDHGGDNKNSSMHPLFVAAGPAFKKNYISKTFNNTDIYVLMCTILGLTPAQHNGSFDNVKQLLINDKQVINNTSTNKLDDNKNDTNLIILYYKSYDFNGFFFNILFVLFIILFVFYLRKVHSNKKKNLSIRAHPIKNIDF